jgi:hypothetical protein
MGGVGSVSIRPKSRRWDVFRIIAALGLVFWTGAMIVTSSHMWSLTTVAPLGWRLRALGTDAILSVPCVVGCAMATFSAAQWRWRLGWVIVLGTITVWTVWTLTTGS